MVQEIKLNQIDTVVTTVGTPWTDDNIPTEKAVRDAIAGAGGDSGEWLLSEIQSVLVWETIAIGEHTSLVTSMTQLILSNKVSTVNLAGTFWQAITLTVDQTLETVKMYVDPPTWITTYTAVVYAATWTVGTNAYPTWAALYTSNTIQTTTGSASYIDFVFTGANLTAGDYAIAVTWNRWTAADLDTYGSTASVHAGNLFYKHWSTGVYTTAVSDLYFVFVFSPWYALLSQANDTNRITYLWKAKTGNTINQSIDIYTEWPATEAGIVTDSQYYLSNTPGTISTTPGTNTILVWKWINTNILRLSPQILWDSLSYVVNTYYYTATTLSISYSQGTPANGLSQGWWIYIWDYNGFIIWDASRLSTTADNGASNPTSCFALIPKGSWFYLSRAGSGNWVATIKAFPLLEFI
jgi:hypothetical protein